MKRMVDLYHLRGDRDGEADARTRYRQLTSGEGSAPWPAAGTGAAALHGAGGFRACGARGRRACGARGRGARADGARRWLRGPQAGTPIQGSESPGSATKAEVRNVPPIADAATLGLWHMDETLGTQVQDFGPSAMLGVAGLETRADFGRFGRARVFSLSLDSFIEVPFNPALDAPASFTIEAWVQPTAYGNYEDTPIAARWTAQNADHSWIFSIVGKAIR